MPLTSISSSSRDDRLPVDRIAERVGIAPRLALELGALGHAEDGSSSSSKAAAVGVDLAVERVDRRLARDAEPAEPLQHDVEAAVLQLVAGADPAEAADLEQGRRLASLGRAAGPCRSAGRRPSRRAPSRGSAARRCAAAAARAGRAARPPAGRPGCGAGAPSARHQVNRIADRRRRCAPTQGSSSPTASISCSSRLRAAPSFHSRSRAMLSSNWSAAASRSPARHQRAGKLVARLVIVGIGGDPRLERRRIAGRADLGERERGAGAGDGRVLRRSSRAAPRACARASSARPAASRARARPEITSGLSGAISRICWKMLAARSASPSPSTSSPIAISGSISASSCCASPSTGSWARIWSSAAFSCAFGPRRAEVGDELALEDGIDGRDRLDPELGRDELLLVDVDLDQVHAAVGIIGGDLFEHRRQLLARPAPFRPEIEDDEAVIDGSTTSRRNSSTASRSASLMPNVATSHSSPVRPLGPLCGKAARSAKPILGIGALFRRRRGR